MHDTDTSPLAWIDAVESRRRAAGLRRELRPRAAVATESRPGLNDYLGLSQHPSVIDGGRSGPTDLGRRRDGVPTGHRKHELHEEFECELAIRRGAIRAGVLVRLHREPGAVVGLSGPVRW